eukprot:TRINITY_DN3504_c0_g1_i2.p1 TRINITY_DN3504_c0_g1~~TRINITY_DN3504_c0_g1_i2.p1  ORF type:complete len:160 (-),score=8.31 TRINITY_DN3504_c0_g1_i2:36-515(-)
MRFVNNRLGFDVSYYKSNSVDQIIAAPVSSATGYTSKLLNAGEIENKGIEVSVNGMPIKNENFTWGINVNWSQNENTVLSLADGIETLQLGSFQGGVTVNAVVGQPYGVIYGQDYTYLNCLLYTSDAADDLLCVDLGGRRIIKKKKINYMIYEYDRSKR